MMYLFLVLCLFIAITSYGFIDPNLILTSVPIVHRFISSLSNVVYQQRPVTAGIFFTVLLLLFFLFRHVFINQKRLFPKPVLFWKWIVIAVLILVFSYPMLSYDLFNYMTTAKVTYTYRENPYVVMPVEIPNDINLAFTRAANKVALYGPTWILMTWFPHALGAGNIWRTIIAFKLFTAIGYLSMCYLIWRITKNMKNVIFFSLNPLIIIETLVSGHNDIIMMVLACTGLLLWKKKKFWNRITGFFIFFLSVFTKGATLVLVPLLFFRQLTKERLMLISSCLLFLIFIMVAPIREELYPWYAIWFLSFAAFLPYPKYALFWQFCIALSLGLELRHVPYMAMGYYEGPGPILRTMMTVIPVAVWGIWYAIRIKNNKD